MKLNKIDIKFDIQNLIIIEKQKKILIRIIVQIISKIKINFI